MFRINTIIILVLIYSCKEPITTTKIDEHAFSKNRKELNDLPLTTNGFDFPVGKPDAKGYYNAQAFGKNNHLGDDWNGLGGGNSDKGDTIYAIANGIVTFADNIKGDWGNVIKIKHTLPNEESVESLYAHCDTILISNNATVYKGIPIATIGTNHGMYLAHLHFEIRDSVGMPIGNGYSTEAKGYLNPTQFIHKNR